MTFLVNTNLSYNLTFSVAEVLHSVFMPSKKKENRYEQIEFLN